MQKAPPRLRGGGRRPRPACVAAKGRGRPDATEEIIIVCARGRATAVRARQAGRDAAARPAPPPFLVSPSPTGASAAGGPVLEGNAGGSWAAGLAARTGRGRVRVADLDAAGAARNVYRREIPVDG